MIVIILICLILVLLILHFSKKEHFNVVKQHSLYSNYRHYIDDNYKYPFLPQTQLFQISDNCFVDHMQRCIGKKNLCQIYSLHKCVGPTRIT